MKKIVSLLLVLAVMVSLCVNTLSVSADTAPTIALSQSSIGIKVGESTQLTVTVNGVATQDVNWTIDDPTIAVVLSDGTIIGTKLGRAVLTATTKDGLASATCYVHVALKGIDVSSWQSVIDWSKAKAAGTDFAILREGYGTEAWDSQTDTYFKTNYDGAKAAGIKVGIYHYSYAMNVQQAVLEADMCLYNLKRYNVQLDYPVFYDVENTSGSYNQYGLSSSTLSQMVVAFCSTIEAGGYKAGLYTNPHFFNNKFVDCTDLDKYDKWIANYQVDTPYVSKPFTIWQYSSSGHVNGVSGAVDVNYSYLDYSNCGPINQNTSGNDTPQPVPVPVVKPTGSITLDTRSYNMAPSNIYDIGVKLVNATGKVIRVYSSQPGVATVKKLSNGNYRITGVSAGTSYIIFDVLSGGGTQLTHASVKITVKRGIRQGGEAVRATSLFYV